jgi:hypothetical protein
MTFIPIREYLFIIGDPDNRPSTITVMVIAQITDFVNRPKTESWKRTNTETDRRNGSVSKICVGALRFES